MNDDKIKLFTDIIYSNADGTKSQQIYIDFSSFDTLNQLINHLCKILNINKKKDIKTELYVFYNGTKLKLFDIKNFYFHLSNCVLLKEKIQLELEFKTSIILY